MGLGTEGHVDFGLQPVHGIVMDTGTSLNTAIASLSETGQFVQIRSRKWVNAGEVAAIRHPVNDYHLFKREDLDALLKRVAAASKKTARK